MNRWKTGEKFESHQGDDDDDDDNDAYISDFLLPPCTF